MNILKHKNRLLDVNKGEFTEIVEQADAPNDIPLSDSIDKFTVALHFRNNCIIFLTSNAKRVPNKKLKPQINGFNVFSPKLPKMPVECLPVRRVLV